MSFLSRIGCIETEEQERARLAQAPEGSLNHYLSTLPVTIDEWPKDLLVELPGSSRARTRSYRIVVVPIEFREEALPEGVEEEPLPRKRHSGAWMCAVVFSDHPDYPASGFRIDVPAAEIVRGRKVDLATALAPLSYVSGETLHTPEPLCGSCEDCASSALRSNATAPPDPGPSAGPSRFEARRGTDRTPVSAMHLCGVPGHQVRGTGLDGARSRRRAVAGRQP